MFKPRPYQVPAAEAALDVMTVTGKVNKSLLVQPTGAGKSWIIANTANEVNEPTLVLQPSKELLMQNYEKLVHMGGDADICCSSAMTNQKKKRKYTTLDNGEKKLCDSIGKLTYATVGSIFTRLDELKELKVKRLIIDEAHFMTQSGTKIDQVVKSLKIKNVLGLTATPVLLKTPSSGAELRMLNRSRDSFFREICHVTQISELVEGGYWTKLVYKPFKVDTSMLRLNSTGNDFLKESQKAFFTANRLERNIPYVVSKLRAEGRKSIIVFVPSISDAMKVYSQIPDSAVVHSKLDTKTRDYVVKAFKRGDIPVVINVNILATGFDDPSVDAIVTARPTNSLAMFYQQCGRGVRIMDGKEDCIIYDMSGNLKMFGKLEGIKFLNVKEDGGWGMYNSYGNLITNRPLSGEEKIDYALMMAEQNRFKEKMKGDSVVIPFGKYKGKTVKELMLINRNYVKWMYEDFNFGDGQELLKQEVYKFMHNTNPTDRF